jgi:integrase
MTISDLAEAVLRDYAVNQRKSLVTVRGRWELHLKPYFGAMPAESLTTETIEDYIALRLREAAQQSTINKELAILKRAYSLAMLAGKLSRRPHAPHLAERNVRKGFLRDGDYQRLAAETRKIGLWLGAMFEVAYTYGNRRSELINLRVRQVNLEEGSINLDPGDTKNEDGRLLPLTAKVREFLEQCIQGKTAEDFVFTRDLDRRGRVAKNGGRVIHFADAWNAACCAAGLGKMVCPTCFDPPTYQADVILLPHELPSSDLASRRYGGKLGKAKPGQLACKCGNRLRADNASGLCWYCQLLPKPNGVKSVRAGCPKCGIARLAKDLKYTGLIFHDLRRSAIRNFMRFGVSEKIAMNMSGHRTRSVFSRYFIVDRAELDAAIKRLETGRQEFLSRLEAESGKRSLCKPPEAAVTCAAAAAQAGEIR